MSVWIIIFLALGFIVSSIFTLKYTANMKMHVPKELKNQFDKQFNAPGKKAEDDEDNVTNIDGSKPTKKPHSH